MRENFTILKQLWNDPRSQSTLYYSESQETMPCRDSGLPHDTRNIVGTSGNVFERLPALKDEPLLSSTILKNLTSSSQELRPDTAGNTKGQESEMRRESQNSSISAPRFQSGGGLLNHTHSGMFRNCIWESLLTPWNFKAGKSTSILEYVQNQQILISQCTVSKKLR